MVVLRVVVVLVVVLCTQKIVSPAARRSDTCGSDTRGSGARVSGTNAKFSKSSRAC